jgi:hypothetical protein
MDFRLEDLTIELISFLDESFDYANFINYMIDKGYTEDEVEEAVDKAREGDLN